VGEHGGDYPNNTPQTITVIDAKGQWAVYVPLRIAGKIILPSAWLTQAMLLDEVADQGRRRTDLTVSVPATTAEPGCAQGQEPTAAGALGSYKGRTARPLAVS
jgi:hypothetical protein